MIQLIILLVIIIALGAFIYISKYRNKEKPKIGIQREKTADYFKDYINLKLYWMSIIFMLFGVIVLFAILIIEFVMD